MWLDELLIGLHRGDPFPSLSRHFPSSLPIDLQSELLKKVLLSESITRFPPDLRTLKSVAKLAMRLAEEGDEVDDALVEFAARCCQADGNGPEAQSFHIVVDGIAVRVNRSFQETGLVVWAAARELARWTRTARDALAGKAVVELGAGTGLGSLHLVKEGIVSDLVVTDHAECVIENLRYNIDCNDLGRGARAARLDWTDLGDFGGGGGDGGIKAGSFDVVLGADITYAPDLMPDLARAIRAVMAPGGVCFIAATERTEDTLNAFRGAVAGQGLLIESQWDDGVWPPWHNPTDPHTGAKVTLFKICL